MKRSDTNARRLGLLGLLYIDKERNREERDLSPTAYGALGSFRDLSDYSDLRDLLCSPRRSGRLCHARLPLPKKEHLGHSQVLAGAQYG